MWPKCLLLKLCVKSRLNNIFCQVNNIFSNNDFCAHMRKLIYHKKKHVLDTVQVKLMMATKLHKKSTEI